MIFRNGFVTILNGLSNIGDWEVVVLDMESLATLNGVVHLGCSQTRLDG